MDISVADKMKWEYRVMLWYLKRHMKKEYSITLKEMEADLNSCGNVVFSELWKIVRNTADQVTEVYQRDIIREFSMVFLWILYRDTAYSPITMYMLKQFFDSQKVLYPAVMKYYVEPKDMYVNAWHDTKAHTKELKDDGKIPNFDGVMGNDEKIFVPPEQEETWKKLSPKTQDEWERFTDEINREFDKKRKETPRIGV